MTATITKTTQQAADELGVTRGRIIQLLNQGRIIGASKFGNQWMIPTPIQITSGSKGPQGIAN